MKKKIIYTICILFVLLQFIPINRKNPPVEAEIIAPERVKSILKRSCYDCHSNETKYPAYSYIFPVSIFLAHHVEEGREELNFSSWESLTSSKKAKKATEIVEEVEKKEMPLFSYTLLHGSAFLSEEDIGIIKSWAQTIEKGNESGN